MNIQEALNAASRKYRVVVNVGDCFYFVARVGNAYHFRVVNGQLQNMAQMKEQQADTKDAGVELKDLEREATTSNSWSLIERAIC